MIPQIDGLTERQNEIVSYVLNGYNSNEIGRFLSISNRTVHAHLRNIYDRCGVSNRVELISLYYRNLLERSLVPR